MTTKSGLVYQPIDYVSDVTYTGQDGIARDATIRVNHPLDLTGTLSYPATFGYGITFTLTKDGKPVAGVPKAPIKEGQGFQIADTPRSIEYTRFVGTTPIDHKTRVSPGLDPRTSSPGDGDRSLRP